MRPDTKRLSAVAVVALATILCGANYSEYASKRAANCAPDDSLFSFCLGPENYQVNAPVSPKTCNGDFEFTVGAVYWLAEEDGLEYAVRNEVIGNEGADVTTGNRSLNNLVDSTYLSPNFKKDFGLKLGASYTSPCDNWDINLLWTKFHQGSSGKVEAEFEDNVTLLPLWSAFQFPQAGNAPILFASDIETFWKFDLNLIDLDLGRRFWTSKYLALHPHVGLRFAYLHQDFKINHRGGSWIVPGLDLRFNGIVDLKNDYEGVGLRSGLDSTWNLGCGWALYGDFSLSVIYGKFKVDHDEVLRNVVAPYSKTKILDTEDHFRASRAILDLGLGIQWSTMFCDCKYGTTLALGWEQHSFFNQNQLWKIKRVSGSNGSGLFNNSGENNFQQRRGTLNTSGWTLTGKLSF